MAVSAAVSGRVLSLLPLVAAAVVVVASVPVPHELVSPISENCTQVRLCDLFPPPLKVKPGFFPLLLSLFACLLVSRMRQQVDFSMFFLFSFYY